MAQWEAKFDWPRDQFLGDRVQWPCGRRVKCEKGKLKRGSQLEFGTLGIGREETSKVATNPLSPHIKKPESFIPSPSKVRIRVLYLRASLSKIRSDELLPKDNSALEGERVECIDHPLAFRVKAVVLFRNRDVEKDSLLFGR